MNQKFKLVRLVVAAAFGSLLWAGCATERAYYTDSPVNLRPIDLTERRANTRPESQTGAEKNAGWDGGFDTPAENPNIREASGAQRP